MYCNFWEYICIEMFKFGCSKVLDFDFGKILIFFEMVFDVFYGYYEKIFKFWKEGGIDVFLCFIVVCNNMLFFKLVYDYISGYEI